MNFIVRAVQAGSQIITLDVDAADSADAERIAKTRGLAVLSVDAKRRSMLAASAKRNRLDLALFSQELLALLQAGINVVEALETLLEKEERPEPRAVLSRVVGHLHEGETLSKALEHVPEDFPALFVAIVRASERTSDLGHGLGRYISYAEQIDRVRNKLVSASIYPLLLIGAGGLVMLFLLGYVVPRFGRIYADLGENLPVLSRVLLHWGRLVESHGLLLLALLVGLGFAARHALAMPALRRRMLERLWAIPTFGARLRVYQLARFYRTLGMLIRGGIPVVAAIDMVSGLLQPTYREHLVAALQSIREGLPISAAFERHQLTTPVALRMLRVGERGGNMGDMMERISDFYDAEFARWVERFTRLFEPILMALIGLVIGVVVVLMYLPIFELAGGLR